MNRCFRSTTARSIVALFATILIVILSAAFFVPVFAHNTGSNSLQFEQSHQMTGPAAVITRTPPPEQCHIMGSMGHQPCIHRPSLHTRVLLNFSPSYGPAWSGFFTTPAQFTVTYSCDGGTGGLAVSGRGWMLFREPMRCDNAWHTVRLYKSGMFQIGVSRGASVVVTGYYS